MHLPTHELEDFEDQSNAEGACHDVIICSFIFDEPIHANTMCLSWGSFNFYFNLGTCAVFSLHFQSKIEILISAARLVWCGGGTWHGNSFWDKLDTDLSEWRCASFMFMSTNSHCRGSAELPKRFETWYGDVSYLRGTKNGNKSGNQSAFIWNGWGSLEIGQGSTGEPTSPEAWKPGIWSKTMRIEIIGTGSTTSIKTRNRQTVQMDTNRCSMMFGIWK